MEQIFVFLLRESVLEQIASGKFEKGLDPENALEAINRACQLVEELGAGEVVGGVVEVYPNPVEEVKIPFEPAKI